MSLYILDTDIVTLHQRNHLQVTTKISAHDPEELAITVITLEEQIRGRLAQIGRSQTGIVAAYERLYATVDYFCGMAVFLFDTGAHEQYRQMREQKVRIGTLDLRIAAIVLAHNAVLVTRNKRDFERVPGLKFEDWSQ